MPRDNALLILASGFRLFYFGAGPGFRAMAGFSSGALGEVFIPIGEFYVDGGVSAFTAAAAETTDINQSAISVGLTSAMLGLDGTGEGWCG